MSANYPGIQELLQQRADIQARRNLMPYNGNPEIKKQSDSIPVQIGGTAYVSPLPIESVVIERIDEIRKQNREPIETAVELCMYCMKTQIFKDGNKRASVIFANHYLIAQGEGLLVIPEKDVQELFLILFINPCPQKL